MAQAKWFCLGLLVVLCAGLSDARPIMDMNTIKPDNYGHMPAYGDVGYGYGEGFGFGSGQGIGLPPYLPGFPPGVGVLPIGPGFGSGFGSGYGFGSGSGSGVGSGYGQGFGEGGGSAYLPDPIPAFGQGGGEGFGFGSGSGSGGSGYGFGEGGGSGGVTPGVVTPAVMPAFGSGAAYGYGRGEGGGIVVGMHDHASHRLMEKTGHVNVASYPISSVPKSNGDAHKP